MQRGGFLEGLLGGLESPLFLGGAALATGGGFDGLNSGIRAGAGLQDRRRQMQEADQKKMAFEGLLGSNMDGVPPQVAQLARAVGPDQGIELLAQYADPMNGIKRKQAETNLAQSQADLAMVPLKRQQLQAQMEQGRNGKFGLQPIYGRDAQGNPIIMQIGPNGEAVQTQMPAGTQLDLGMKSFEQASGRERGQVQGTSQASLPLAKRNADKIIENLDAVLGDPYLDSMTGPVAGRLPNISGPANRVQARLDQIQGQTFLQAFESLKGAGQITEVEGQKATDSLNRLRNTRMGTEDYVIALREFKKDVQDLYAVVQMKAGGSSAPAQAPAPQQPSPIKSMPGFSMQRIE